MRGRNVVQAVLFQVAWFACVLGGAQGTSLWGAAALLALVTFSLSCATAGRDLVLASVAAALGFFIDTVWIRTGVLDYAGAAVAPLWIVLLWAGVGLSLNHSLSMFLARPWLGGMLAGAAAPFSYLAGEGFGAVSVPQAHLLGLVSVVWLMVFGVAFVLAAGGAATHRSVEEEP